MEQSNKTLTALISLFLLVGCSTVPLSTSEKVHLGLNAGLQAGDYITTKNILDDGGRELNPVYGSYPSDDKLIAGKVIAWAVTYWTTKMFDSHQYRRRWLWYSNFFMAGVVIHNYNEME